MIWVDYTDRRPIYEQIVSRFEDMVLQGIFLPDSQVPSVRSLAMELSINPNTIQRAYGELERKGFIYTIKGKGSFVAPTNHLMEMKRQEIIQQLKVIHKQSKILGVTSQELIDWILQWEREG